MGKNDVKIVVKARDEASRKFNKISKSAGGMGSMLRKAAAAAVVYFGARSLIRFTRSSMELFGRQEAAVVRLRNALLLLGEQQADEIGMHKKWASEIQQATKYGDEEILELMSMGSAMGKLHGKQLQEATKAAIGLSVAYGIELAGSMRLVARAAVGDTSSLTRYGIKIDAALSMQEKFNKVLEIGSRNFKLAEGDAATYLGRIQQMKNAIGDVKEEIGKALAPTIKASAVHIRKWAEDNQKKIGEWATKTISYVSLTKDVFMSFAGFLKNDWKSAVDFVFDSFIVTMKAAFETAIDLSIAGGKGIWEGIKKGLSGGGEATINRITAESYKAVGGKFNEPTGKTSFASKLFSQGSREQAADQKLWDQAKKIAEQKYQKKQVDSILGNTLATAMARWKAAGKEIVDSMPKGLADSVDAAFGKHLARLEVLNTPAAIAAGNLPTGVASPATDADKATVIIGGGTRRLGAAESRFLTMRAGTQLTPADKNTGKMVDQLKGIADSINKQLIAVLEANGPGGIPPVTVKISNA